MGYFQVRYNSIVINYDRSGFIRLATDSEINVMQNVFVGKLVRRLKFKDDKLPWQRFCLQKNQGIS